MNRKVKRYDPISSDGTCGMCIEDADYGAYVEYSDYAALEAELAKLRAGQEPVAWISWTNEDPEWKLKMLAEPVHPPVVPLKLYTAPPPSAVPDIAGWLWHWLMDYCKKNSQPPATRNDLFAVVSDLRKMLAAATYAPKADDPVKQMMLEALNGMLLHIREPESESEFQWPEHFKKQKAAFAAARAAIAAAQEGGKV